MDAARRSVEWVIDDGNRASEVIRRVRLLTNKTEIEKVPLDVNEVVREAIGLMQRELIGHQVSLRMELASALPVVLGDRVQLQQVIINLVMNGIEAMQPVTDRQRQFVIRSRQDDTTVARKFDRLWRRDLSENAAGCSTPFSPPNPPAWVWDSRSAIRSWKPMAAGCGPPQMYPGVHRSSLRCR